MRYNRLIMISMLTVFFFVVGFAASGGPTLARSILQRVGYVEHRPIVEMSGIVKSQAHDDVWWVHNDGGSEPRLFAIDGRGDTIVPPLQLKVNSVGREDAQVDSDRQLWRGIEILSAANIDWEDIALADDKIYIADTGNNDNARRDLGVYVLIEPNPRVSTRARVLKFLPVAYPDQNAFPGSRLEFDCESLFVSEGKIYFLTKHRSSRRTTKYGTALYRLDTEFVDRLNSLVRIEGRSDIGIPTGACLSPSGGMLAVLTYNSVWVFDKPESGDHWLSSRARFVLLPMAVTKQIESICWDDEETMRIANEQRELFCVKLDSLKPRG